MVELHYRFADGVALGDWMKMAAPALRQRQAQRALECVEIQVLGPCEIERSVPIVYVLVVVLRRTGPDPYDGRARTRRGADLDDPMARKGLSGECRVSTIDHGLDIEQLALGRCAQTSAVKADWRARQTEPDPPMRTAAIVRRELHQRDSAICRHRQRRHA